MRFQDSRPNFVAGMNGARIRTKKRTSSHFITHKRKPSERKRKKASESAPSTMKEQQDTTANEVESDSDQEHGQVTPLDDSRHGEENGEDEVPITCLEKWSLRFLGFNLATVLLTFSASPGDFMCCEDDVISQTLERTALALSVLYLFFLVIEVYLAIRRINLYVFTAIVNPCLGYALTLMLLYSSDRVQALLAFVMETLAYLLGRIASYQRGGDSTDSKWKWPMILITIWDAFFAGVALYVIVVLLRTVSDGGICVFESLDGQSWHFSYRTTQESFCRVCSNSGLPAWAVDDSASCEPIELGNYCGKDAVFQLVNPQYSYTAYPNFCFRKF
jgi:hypothetical protein